MRKIIAKLLLFVMVATQIQPSGHAAQAASKAPKLNKKTATISVGKSVKLKVKNTKKKVATVNKKGVVKGKKVGTAKITAKVGKKQLTCKIKVKKKAIVQKK